MENFSELLQRLMSGNNAVRNEAEQFLFGMVEQQPDKAVCSLLESIAVGQKDEPEMACLLLRQLFTTSRAELWGRISPSSQQRLKHDLCRFLQTEAPPDLLFKVCDVAAAVGCAIMPNNEWQELLPFLETLVQSSNNIQRICGYKAFEQLIQSLRVKLRQFNETIRGLLFKGLEDEDAHVRIAALATTNSFLQTERDEIPVFEPMVPNIVEIIHVCLNNNGEEDAREALIKLIELAEIAPKLIRPHLKPVCDAMFELAADMRVEEQTRHMSAELVVTLCEARPGMVRKEETILPRLVRLLLEMMQDVSENEDWNEGEEEDIEDVNVKVAGESLDRLAIQLTGSSLVPIVFDVVPDMLASEDWRQRHAALMSISVIGEGCRAFMKPHLDHVLEFVLPRFVDDHPRVRWAACNALGQMCTDFGPTIQRDFHNDIIPRLAHVMEDSDNPRVQSHACAALINFNEFAKKEHMEEGLHPLLETMAVLLEQNRKIVLEQCMTAIGTVADVVKSDFEPYYDSFMPFLKTVFKTATSKDLRYLRGRSLEAISLIAAAVGHKQFAADADEVLGEMLNLQRAELDADDPMIGYLQQAWARMAKALKQHFVPYLPEVIPRLLREASVDPEVQILTRDDAARLKDDEDWEVIPIGDRHVSIKTSTLEIKGQACNMLYCYLEELKGGFFPYVNDTAALYSSLICFYYHDGTRIAAVSSPIHILQCVKDYYEQQNINPKPHVVEMFTKMLPDICQGLDLEMSPDIMTLLSYSTHKCIDIAGEYCLSSSDLELMAGHAHRMLEDFWERHKEREAKRQDEDFDEVEEERLEAEHKKDEEVLALIAEIIGSLARTHKERFLPYFNHIACSEVFHNLLDPETRPRHRQAAICIFDDVVEFAGPSARNFYSSIFNTFMNYVMDPEGIVRQASIYGIGQMVMADKSVVAPKINEVLEAMHQQIVHPDAQSEELITVTENAVSVLCRICKELSDQVDVNEILPVALEHLPLNADPDECACIHDLLCDFIDAIPATVFGEKFERLPKVLSILVTVIAKKLGAPKTFERMVAILRTMQNEIPGDVLGAAFEELDDECKAKLQEIMS